MADLPPLTKVWAKGPESGLEFERLMKKLLIHDGKQNGYVFEPGATYKEKGIDGIVRANYSGIRPPVIFQFKWLEGPIHKGSPAQQIKKSFESLLTADIIFKSYVLVTPHNLTSSEKDWFEKLQVDSKVDIAVYHFGHDQIQVLLDAYPVLKKYCYGVQVDGEIQNFNWFKEKYRIAISEEVKYLHFLGLPTGHYQRQHELEKPKLVKVYIPLDFTGEPGDSSRKTLMRILKESHRVVVLGDPGSGKSTLAKYLASIHTGEPSENRKPGAENRIPFIIPIREFVRRQQEKKGQAFNFIDYLKTVADSNFSFNDIDKDFFIAQLDMGKAIVLFDGLDEVASESGRVRVAQDIQHFSLQYPDSPIWVTSRVVGYTVNVKLAPEEFNHFYLAPVTPTQAVEFIKKWYEIQIPNNETARNDRVHSLQYAIENNPGVQRLKTNPLLLTMMTLVHQFEGTLPDDRAWLYDKCIELLLKSWQEPVLIALGTISPLEVRELSYNDQLKMLAATAFYIQEKNQDRKEDTRGLITEKELIQVLFKARYDEGRMSTKKAKEDVRVFLDYIRDRAGLLVEKGRNEKKENVFSFVHLSFMEYLCAYQVAEDKSKSQQQHIDRLLSYIAKPAWEDSILLSLYLFSRSTGPSFIDDFSKSIFKKLAAAPDLNGWFLLGRAVRDNIKFTQVDVKLIIGQILEIYLIKQRAETSLSILREIAHFSKEGKKVLKEAIEKSMKTDPSEKAFESLYLYSQFYEFDPQLPGIISGNKDRSDLFAYLPIFRANKILEGYFDQNLVESHWALYYAGASDKTVGNLERLYTGQLKPIELRGYILSIWSKLFNAFQERREFLNINQSQEKLMDRIESLHCRFGSYAAVHYPLKFIYFGSDLENVIISKISNPGFASEDRKMNSQVNAKFLEGWVNRILSNAWLTIEHPPQKNIPGTDSDKKKKTDINILNDLDLNLDLSKKLSRHFSYYVIQHFSLDLCLNLSQNLHQDLNRSLNREFSRKLCRGFNLDVIRTPSPELIDFISDLFSKKFKDTLEWGEVSEKRNKMIFNRIVEELEDGNIESLDSFFENLYFSLFIERFKLLFDLSSPIVQSFGGKMAYRSLQKQPSLSLKNPLLIPFSFNFIFSSALNHYFFNMLAELNRKFHKEKNLKEEMIIEAVDDYVYNNPFALYFVNFSWDFYAKAFNERYRGLRDGEEKNLALAAFVVNAARVSLLTDVPCAGDEWEKTLTAANNSTHPFVQISLTLYKICNFMDKDKTPALLNEQLAQFKKDFPQYYKLIGFQEK